MHSVISHASKILIFVLGIIVTLAIGQGWQHFFPASPVIVKSSSDTIRIVHEMNIEDDSNTSEQIIKKKLEQITLLNRYDEEMARRAKLLESPRNIRESALDSESPNLIITQLVRNTLGKGHLQDNASSYMSVACPEYSNDSIIAIRPKFFNSKIIPQVAFFRVYASKYNNESSPYANRQILNEAFEPKADNRNRIEIGNILRSGKYDLRIGFVFKSDTGKKYPEFYQIPCLIQSGAK